MCGRERGRGGRREAVSMVSDKGSKCKTERGRGVIREGEVGETEEKREKNKAGN